MIARPYFIASISIAGLLLLALTDAHAGQDCKTTPGSYALSLDLPHGCLYSRFVREQIANPKDRFHPRAETPADAKRRIKTLSDWQNNTAKPKQADETSK